MRLLEVAVVTFSLHSLFLSLFLSSFLCLKYRQSFSSIAWSSVKDGADHALSRTPILFNTLSSLLSVTCQVLSTSAIETSGRSSSLPSSSAWSIIVFANCFSSSKTCDFLRGLCAIDREKAWNFCSTSDVISRADELLLGRIGDTEGLLCERRRNRGLFGVSTCSVLLLVVARPGDFGPGRKWCRAGLGDAGGLGTLVGDNGVEDGGDLGLLELDCDLGLEGSADCKSLLPKRLKLKGEINLVSVKKCIT